LTSTSSIVGEPIKLPFHVGVVRLIGEECGFADCAVEEVVVAGVVGRQMDGEGASPSRDAVGYDMSRISSKLFTNIRSVYCK